MKQKVLRQAFQETDGRVTRQEITGKDGQPLETNVTQKQAEEAVAKAQQIKATRQLEIILQLSTKI
ncbi:hypothetical protein SAMN05421733_103247 [Acinetobacter boissieri]|uniref:Uncharacterized protein n=1 Tax=Acinetobacter boissieri TaxID=1219383 RepID=A0A1G6H3Q8_9GAMM|nr:hypothetical protein SAMN05421733_103247 [Acinetobacter boissieri]